MRQVKKFESGMVVNPLTIHPDATLADALALMQEHRISGIPVVEGGGNGHGKAPASWSASSPTATCALPPTSGKRSPS